MLGLRAEIGHGFVDRHVQHLGDRLAAELDVQRLAVVARALAGVAGHEHVRQEVHFYLKHAVALARLAAAALDVEAEPAGFVAARADSGSSANQSRIGANRSV